jgi:hypothetical protein
VFLEFSKIKQIGRTSRAGAGRDSGVGNITYGPSRLIKFSEEVEEEEGTE